KKAKLPTHIEISARESNLERDSVILLEQVRTIDKKRLQRHVTHLDQRVLEKVDKAIEISLGLIEL
ncbi:MAG: type II toxin-antitoxin system PemK/MazF family toxin, partial [Bacillota bacterium]